MQKVEKPSQELEKMLIEYRFEEDSYFHFLSADGYQVIWASWIKDAIKSNTSL